MTFYQLKLNLRNLFVRFLDKLGLSQQDIGNIVGLTQARVSQILR